MGGEAEGGGGRKEAQGAGKGGGEEDGEEDGAAWHGGRGATLCLTLAPYATCSEVMHGEPTE